MPIRRQISNPHMLAWTVLTAVLVLCILFFGLRPKRRPFLNAVSLQPEVRTLVFNKHGMAYVEDMVGVRSANLAAPLTITLAVRAGSLAQDRFRSILMLHDGKDAQQLIIGQWGDSVIVMNGDDYDHSQRRPRLVKSQAISDAQARFITITADNNGSRLYIDGSLVRNNQKWQLTVPRIGPKLHMVIGNSVSGKLNWTGSIYGLALYSTVQPKETIKQHYHQWRNTAIFPYDTGAHLMAAYVFDGQKAHQVQDVSGNRQLLALADQPVVLKKTFLKLPWRQFRPNRSFFVDALLNFIGFIPLGAVMLVWLRSFLPALDKWLIPATLGFCFLLSLSIEISQAWQPNRDSDLLDLVLNTSGAWAGMRLLKIGSLLRIRK